jgi:hypothetical protein
MAADDSPGERRRALGTSDGAAPVVSEQLGVLQAERVGVEAARVAAAVLGQLAGVRLARDEEHAAHRRGDADEERQVCRLELVELCGRWRNEKREGVVRLYLTSPEDSKRADLAAYTRATYLCT